MLFVMSFISALMFFGALFLGEEEVTATEIQSLVNSSEVDTFTCCNNSFFTPIMVAAMRGHTQEVERILQEMKKLDHLEETTEGRDEEGMTPLLWAALRGRVEVMRKLMDYGANVHAVDNSNSTVLHLSALSGSAGAVRLVILSNCSVDARNADGDTALHIAAREGDFDVAEILLSNGAATHVTNLNRITPLGLAFRNGNAAIKRLLKVAGEPPGGHRWEGVEDKIPSDAVIGGNDPDHLCDPVFVGRVRQDGLITPVKICKGLTDPFEARLGREVIKTGIEVLCSNNIAWKVTTDKEEIPPEAVEGGTTENGEKLYIGRGFVSHSIDEPDDDLHTKAQFLALGKINAMNKCLYIAIDGNVYEKKKYEILITF